jgi:hypothetical protein
MFSTVRIRPEFMFSPAQQIDEKQRRFLRADAGAKSSCCSGGTIVYTLLEGGREAVSRGRATPAPLLESLLEFDLRGPTPPLALQLGIPEAPVAAHRAEAILIDSRNVCDPLHIGCPLRASELAASWVLSTWAGVAIRDRRLCAQIPIGVDELWRHLPEKYSRQHVTADDWTDISLWLDDYACTAAYDLTGVAFFDAHQTWGERVSENRRARAAFLKDCEE